MSDTKQVPSPALLVSMGALVALPVLALLAGPGSGPIQLIAVLGVTGLIAVGLVVAQRRTSAPIWTCAVGVAVLQPLNGLRPLPGVAVGDVGLVILAAVCLVTLRRATISAWVAVPLLGTLLLTAAGLIGSIATQDFTQAAAATNVYGGTGTQVFKFVLGAPLVVVVLSCLDLTPRACIVLARSYGVGATLSAIAAASGRTDPILQRAFGFGEHLMHLALSCLFAIVVAIGWMLTTDRRSVRLACAVVVVVDAYALVLTGSRIALLATLAAVGFLCALRGARGVVAYAAALGSAAAALLAVAPLLPAGSTLARLRGGTALDSLVTASNDAHLQLARQAIVDIGAHPLTGSGFGQGLEAHNLFLQGADIGGPLGILGLLLIWGTFAVLWSRLLLAPPARRDLPAAAMLTGCAGYFVLAQFENLIWDRHLWFFLTVSLIAHPVGRRRLASPTHRTRDRRLGRPTRPTEAASASTRLVGSS